MSELRTGSELAILRTFAEYCIRCDDGDFAALVELFTPDGELVYGDATARGPGEILAFYEAAQGLPSQRGKHLGTNALIDIDGERATAQSDFLFCRFVDGVFRPAIAGRYRDELRCIDGRWRFARREINAMTAPAG